MVALTSFDVRLTVALTMDLPIFWRAGTGCVAPVSNKNRSIKVSVAGKACVWMIELLFGVFVEAFQTKLVTLTSFDVRLACTVASILVTASIRRLHRSMDVTCALLASVRILSGKVPVAWADNL